MSAVNHPAHYNTGKIEVIDAIEDWGLDFHLGNVVKYVARAKHKGNELEDLQKARWYLQRRIQQLYADTDWNGINAETTDIAELSKASETNT